MTDQPRFDSSDWTGLPSTVRRADGPYGDCMSEADAAAMWREEVAYARLQRLKALAMLWGPAIVDVASTRWRRDGIVNYSRQRGEEWTLGRALLATIAIALDRTHGQREAEAHQRKTGRFYVSSFDLGHWDAHSDGYGYSAMLCCLYPGARVQIFSDGESWM